MIAGRPVWARRRTVARIGYADADKPAYGFGYVMNKMQMVREDRAPQGQPSRGHSSRRLRS